MLTEMGLLSLGWDAFLDGIEDGSRFDRVYSMLSGFLILSYEGNGSVNKSFESLRLENVFWFNVFVS